MIRGRARVVGDNVDTDAIIPARYLSAGTAGELGAHCLEGLVPRMDPPLSPGDIVVAGHNFGCGSSREHAALALLGAGVQCVVARSFARIFFRNAVNTGLIVVECPDIVDVADGSEVVVDGDGGVVQADDGREFSAMPLPEFIQVLISAGGLVPHVRRRLQGGSLQ